MKNFNNHTWQTDGSGLKLGLSGRDHFHRKQEADPQSVLLFIP